MIHNLGEKNSILNQFVGELRDRNVQKDRMRFRTNLHRIGNIMAYEISRYLEYNNKAIETPLGATTVNVVAGQIVLATILRAGVPLHNGILEFFDFADNAFVAALRMHHKDGSFHIEAGYITSPNLENATLIVSDPMLATGSSAKKALDLLLHHGRPKAIHFATVIASVHGINYLRREYPDVHIWTAAIDEELTGKSYIVPGLGDAGDLAYGPKVDLE